MINFLIEDILAENMISMRIGSSGTGKTTWDLQTFEAAACGALAFGRFVTKPLQPVWYVSLDRTPDELEGKFNSIQIPLELFKFAGYRDQLTNKYLLEKIFNDIPPGTKIVVLDGVGFLVERVISQYHVGQVISRIDKLRAKAQVSLSLIHHAPKVKGSENYDDPREMVLGSGAWCQMAATSVIFRKLVPADVNNPYRRVWIVQNNAPDREYAFKLTNRLEWLPDGFPKCADAKGWTIAQVMIFWECSEFSARTIWRRIQNGEDPSMIEGGPTNL
jgi:hypothetical protein